MRWLRFVLAFAAVATVYFHRLDRPLLWDDEADTGVNARNVLRSGVPSAFDGRNVIYFDNGAQLNRRLLSKEIPWGQYYLGALSLAVFGNTTAGLRALFAMAGLLAFFPLWAVLSRPLPLFKQSDKSRFILGGTTSVSSALGPRQDDTEVVPPNNAATSVALFRGPARSVRFPEIAAALVLLAPQTVLFQRNARYYPILVLLYACLVWHLSRDFKSRKVRFATGSVLFLLFFHIHPFAAACAAAALVLFCLFWRRPLLPAYLAAALLGLVSWLAWYRLLGPPLRANPLASEHLIFSHFGAWCGIFFRDFFATLADLDAVGSLPLLLLAAAVAVILLRERIPWRGERAGPLLLNSDECPKGRTELSSRGPARFIALWREPIFGFVLLTILVQSVASAAVFGTEAAPRFAMLRYMPHLAAFGLAACFVAVDAALATAKRGEDGFSRTTTGLAIGVFAVAGNFATLSHWAKPFGRQVPASWTGPVYAEIFDPPPEAWTGAIGALREQAAPGGEGVIFAMPEWTQAMLVFYLGDRYIVPPDSLVRTPAGWRAQGPDPYLRQVLGDEAYHRLNARPEWLVDSIRQFETAPGGFAADASFSSYRASPHDGSRPELTRHAFPQDLPVAEIAIYRWTGR